MATVPGVAHGAHVMPRRPIINGSSTSERVRRSRASVASATEPGRTCGSLARSDHDRRKRRGAQDKRARPGAAFHRVAKYAGRINKRGGKTNKREARAARRARASRQQPSLEGPVGLWHDQITIGERDAAPKTNGRGPARLSVSSRSTQGPSTRVVAITKTSEARAARRARASRQRPSLEGPVGSLARSDHDLRMRPDAETNGRGPARLSVSSRSTQGPSTRVVAITKTSEARAVRRVFSQPSAWPTCWRALLRAPRPAAWLAC